MKVVKVCLVVCAALLFAASAQATQLEYKFDSGTFYPRFYEAGTTAGDYTYRSAFDLSGLTLTLDTDDGSARLFGDFEGALQDRSGATIGTSTASLDLTFLDLEFGPTVGDPNKPIVAIGREGTSTSDGTFSFQLDFDNRPLEAETINVYGGFANVGANHAKFGDIAGIPFNFLLRENGQFDVWVKSQPGGNFTLFNEPFQLHGDIHGTTEVPEPATMALLSAGLWGLVRRRKQKAA